MTVRKLRIGIIGAGGFAAQHMEAFAEIPEVEVVAFMRRCEGPLREMQKQWDVPKGYRGHREMLDDPDIDAIDIIRRQILTSSTLWMRLRLAGRCCARSR